MCGRDGVRGEREREEMFFCKGLRRCRSHHDSSTYVFVFVLNKDACRLVNAGTIEISFFSTLSIREIQKMHDDDNDDDDDDDYDDDDTATTERGRKAKITIT